MTAGMDDRLNIPLSWKQRDPSSLFVVLDTETENPTNRVVKPLISPTKTSQRHPLL